MHVLERGRVAAEQAVFAEAPQVAEFRDCDGGWLVGAVVDKVLAMSATPGMQEWGMRMIVVARCIERIGDNAVDIGEQVSFLVSGEFREFTDASHPGGVAADAD